MMSPSLTTRLYAPAPAVPPPLGPFITFGTPVLARLFSITPRSWSAGFYHNVVRVVPDGRILSTAEKRALVLRRSNPWVRNDRIVGDS